MEEIPLNPNKSAPETELQLADPEKIGDLLLRYELPKSEPSRAVPLASEQAPKLIISREKLRDRIGRYKELKFSRTKEQAEEPKQPEQLTEAHFERRHEIRDEETPTTADTNEITQSTPVSIASLPPATPQSPPAVPPPFVPQKPIITNQPQPTVSKPYKKPLIFGLVAGALTALTLITVYFR